MDIGRGSAIKKQGSGRIILADRSQLESRGFYEDARYTGGKQVTAIIRAVGRDHGGMKYPFADGEGAKYY